MKIIAIDTTTEACSVALMCDNDVFIRHEIKPRQHTKLVLKFIYELLSKAELELSQLDGLAVSVGPGCFTGVRIGIAVAQGLAYGASLPIAPISTLAVLAQGAYRKFGAEQILVAIDARMKQIYFGEYKINQNNLVVRLSEDKLICPEQLTTDSISTKQAVAVGRGWLAYEQKLKQINQILIKNDNDALPEAEDLLTLSCYNFSSQIGLVDAMNLIPVYLRNQVTTV